MQKLESVVVGELARGGNANVLTTTTTTKNCFQSVFGFRAHDLHTNGARACPIKPHSDFPQSETKSFGSAQTTATHPQNLAAHSVASHANWQIQIRVAAIPSETPRGTEWILCLPTIFSTSGYEKQNQLRRRKLNMEWPGRDADSSERSEPMPEWDAPSPATSSRRCELEAANHRRIAPRKARSSMHIQMPHEPEQWAQALRPRSAAQ